MKYLLSFFVLLSSLIINAQDVVGKYQLKVDATNGELSRTLTLSADGTFEFYNYERHDIGIPPEKHLYAKGTWTSDKNVIIFSAEPSDIDDTHVLNFNTTRARYKEKSSRDKSDRVVETSLIFYQSEIFWVKGMKLLKQ